MSRRPRRVLTLGALAALALAPARLEAGPLEARAAWEHAKALQEGPWRARVLALRAARAATTPSDPLYPRILSAEARALRDVRRVHAAAALEARAAALGPERDPDRAPRLLTQARALLSEEDRAAAAAPLEAAAAIARTATPWRADEALEALARLAADDHAAAALRLLCVRAERESARPSTRIALWGRLGLAVLETGARAEAQGCLARAGQAFRTAAHADPREAARSAATWLDLPLRTRLGPR